MKKQILIIIITAMSLYGLSDDIKYDMYKEKFLQNFKSKNYSEALNSLEKMKKLKKNLPSSVLYFEGKALFESGSKAKSYSKFEQYVEKTGKNGKYYKKSLSYLIKAEPIYIKEKARLEKARLKHNEEVRLRIIAEKKEIEFKKRKIEDKALKNNKIIYESISHRENLIEEIEHLGFTYGVIKSPITNKKWLDRNLGAKSFCHTFYDKNCFGHLYQWGRATDGHQKINSSFTRKFSSSSQPNHNKFIANSNEAYELGIIDWFKKGDNNLWKDGSSKNNPCPKGYKVPSFEEIKKEFNHINSKNKGPSLNDSNFKLFFSFLKIPEAGYRDIYDKPYYIYKKNYYPNVQVWTSSTSSVPWAGKIAYKGDTFRIDYSSIYRNSKFKFFGYPVRCIED